jgi:hypothetical protein
LRTFHESGRAILPVNSEIINFLKDHLINVETTLNAKTNQETTILNFDTNQFPESLITLNQTLIIIPGLIEVKDNSLIFGEDYNVIENQDVISVVEDIKQILRQGVVKNGVIPYYTALMTAMLEVGNLYSSFVEILFTNMFLTDYDQKKFWRYNQDTPPNYKLGDKMMAAYISSRIGLLYQPNKNTIEQVDLEEMDDIDLSNLTIYEKIYLGQV